MRLIAIIIAVLNVGCCSVDNIYLEKFFNRTYDSAEVKLFKGSGAEIISGVERKFESKGWIFECHDVFLTSSFFDCAEVFLTYKTKIPFDVWYYGHFPYGATRRECINMMDSFIDKVNRKYNATISRAGYGNVNFKEPLDFVSKEYVPSMDKKHDRYQHFGKGDSFFACYTGSICQRYYINMQAYESRHGERVVMLMISDDREDVRECRNKENIFYK